MDELRALLLPGEKDRKRAKMRQVRETLEREVNRGPMKVKLMSRGKKGKKKGSMSPKQ